MKQKIKEAITQGYKNLGVPESVVDGLTALGVTVVKDDSEIEGFVQSEAVKGVMKSWQSEADKIRTKASDGKKAEYEAKIAELEAKLTGSDPTPHPKPEPAPDIADIADIVAKAVAAAINPMQEKLTAFETAQTQKSAVAALDELKATWDYAKGYPAECADAYERVMELYEVGGRKWTADELKAKFTEKFNKAVSRKGVDTSKPFPSDGGGSSEAERNRAFADEIRAALGIDKDDRLPDTINPITNL